MFNKTKLMFSPSDRDLIFSILREQVGEEKYASLTNIPTYVDTLINFIPAGFDINSNAPDISWLYPAVRQVIFECFKKTTEGGSGEKLDKGGISLTYMTTDNFIISAEKTQ